jgi:hypothetical protein
VPRLPLLALALVSLSALLAACPTAFEAVLEIETVGRERIEKTGGAELHPFGDRVAVPRDAREAYLRVGTADEVALDPGEEIVLEVQETAEAPGVLSRVLAGGKEVARAPDRLKVVVRWSSTEVRDLLPKTETLELEIEPGGEKAVDLTVLHTPLPGTRLEGVETRVRLAGPDADRLQWVPAEPVRNGRVRGKVVARKE